MGTRLTAETPASAQARAEAAAEWLDSDCFEALLDPVVCRGLTLKVLRQTGRLLGVWISESDAYLYPAWQLDSSGRPSPILWELLLLLRGPFGVADAEPTSGWEEIEWLIAPHALLDGCVPAQMLTAAPDRVLDVAKQDFSSWSAEARW